MAATGLDVSARWFAGKGCEVRALSEAASVPVPGGGALRAADGSCRRGRTRRGPDSGGCSPEPREARQRLAAGFAARRAADLRGRFGARGLVAAFGLAFALTLALTGGAGAGVGRAGGAVGSGVAVHAASGRV